MLATIMLGRIILKAPTEKDFITQQRTSNMKAQKINVVNPILKIVG